MRRVVITGVGAVTPLGNTVADTWAALCAGRSGIGSITKFDSRDFATKIAAEVKNFDPLTFVNKKDLRHLDDFIVYALAAADMAVTDAALPVGNRDGARRGVSIGSAIGGLRTLEKQKEILTQAGPRRVSPFTIPAVLANLAVGHVSIRLQAKGPIACSTTACASGTCAVGDALGMIKLGRADVMIAGGVDAAVTPMAVAGFNALRALSTRNEEPKKASRPFDARRDGFVIGEGCGLLVLEELSVALERGARIYAEIAGYGLTSDAHHPVAPPPGHEGAVRCMQAALKDAGALPEDVDYINAHGTSTPLNDKYENDAIKAAFGEHSKMLAVSSTKSMTGHLLGAAGGVEAIVAALAVNGDIMPPTINLDFPDPDCDLDYLPHEARKGRVRMAMSNTFGFGGVNAALIFKKYVD